MSRRRRSAESADSASGLAVRTNTPLFILCAVSLCGLTLLLLPSAMMQYVRTRAAASLQRASVPRRALSSSLTPEELESRYLLGNYSSDAVRISRGLVFERGEGSHLFASDGRAYLDFFGGIAVNALGHSDAGVARVLAAQALKIQHTSVRSAAAMLRSRVGATSLL